MYKRLQEAPPVWDKLTVNMEIDDIDGEIVSSEESDLWVNGESKELDLTFEASEYFEKLREIMTQNDRENRAWTICDLEIQNNGQFKFTFSYDEPPRLATLKE